MNNKKRYTIIAIFLMCTLNAQFRIKDRTENLNEFDYQTFSWGYYLGISMFTFKLHPNMNDENLGLNDNYAFTVASIPKMGFSAGLIGKKRLNDHFDLRVEPAMHFAQRDLIFTHVKRFIPSYQGIPIAAKDTIRSVKSSYLDLPVFINFHGNRYYNTRPYIQMGLGWAINLQANENKKDDNLNGVFRTTTHNFNWQAEFGVEIYFKRFKLTPSARGIIFFNNELVLDNPSTPPLWANSLKAIYTRAFLFSLKFE